MFHAVVRDRLSFAVVGAAVLEPPRFTRQRCPPCLRTVLFKWGVLVVQAPFLPMGNGGHVSKSHDDGSVCGVGTRFPHAVVLEVGEPRVAHLLVPKGELHEHAVNLETPVFVLREMPIREIQKRVDKKLEEMQNPAQ